MNSTVHCDIACLLVKTWWPIDNFIQQHTTANKILNNNCLDYFSLNVLCLNNLEGNHTKVGGTSEKMWPVLRVGILCLSTFKLFPAPLSRPSQLQQQISKLYLLPYLFLASILTIMLSLHLTSIPPIMPPSFSISSFQLWMKFLKFSLNKIVYNKVEKEQNVNSEHTYTLWSILCSTSSHILTTATRWWMTQTCRRLRTTIARCNRWTPVY